MGPEEFVRWLDTRPPSDVYDSELLNGRVVMTPPAAHPHGMIGSALQLTLSMFLRLERALERRARLEGEFPPIVPDLVVEVLSRSTTSRDCGEKKGSYERNGIREYWLVDAIACAITVFVLKDGSYGVGRVFREGERIRSEILEGLEEDVSALVVGGQDGVRSDT